MQPKVQGTRNLAAVFAQKRLDFMLLFSSLTAVSGGIGQIDDRHTEKKDAIKGMLIVQVGGPAYRVGFGGGAASS